jgi:enoyl-CoA hydratase
VEVVVSDGVGRLTLNRPGAINALTLEMISALAAALDFFEENDLVERVELRGEGERGFSAGADVRQLRDWALEGRDTLEFFASEYRLNQRILTYPKPFTAYLHGITMGGGMGISVHAGERVADANTVMAMPETKIGLFPDVLMSWHLAWLPSDIGTHLAMSGAPFNVGDALWLRLVDTCEGTAPDPVLPEQAEWIAECYVGSDPAAIVQRLEQHSSPQARAAGAQLRERCPLSVAVSLEAIRQAQEIHTLEEQVAQETVLAHHMSLRPDFSEGVRAQLVDKDFAPKWQHARIEDVTRAEVLAAFETHPEV